MRAFPAVKTWHTKTNAKPKAYRRIPVVGIVEDKQICFIPMVGE